MAIEQQVNVQELQRLNDAIVTTLESIRRVLPQLAQLQQAATMPHIGTQLPFAGLSGMGLPYTSLYGQIPNLAANPLLGAQAGVTGLGGMWGGLPYGGLPYGGVGQQVIDPVTSAYVQAHAQALRNLIAQSMMPFGATQAVQPSFGQWGFTPQVTPFVSPTQRPF